MSGILDTLSSFEKACENNVGSPACALYVKDRMDDIQKEALARKSDTYSRLYGSIETAANADEAAAVYATRQATVGGFQEAVQSLNNSAQNADKFNKDLSKRQFEINEWYYQNKLETLFFLQVFLISTLIMTIIIYMFKRGYMTASATGLSVVALGSVVVIVGITRYFYTSRTRDRRLWHRRYFGEMEPVKPDLLSCPTPLAPSPSGLVLNLNAIFDPKTTRCATALSPAYSKWFDTNAAEIINYQLANAPVSSIFGTVSNVPDECRR